MMAFRECYGRLHELRSLAPNVRMIALTATATKLTKATILSTLLMGKSLEIQESPNKPNVTYVGECIQKDKDHEWYFEWLVEELRTRKTSSVRTIIYCQTIKQCSLIFGIIKGMLGKDIYVGTEKGTGNVLVEMLHSCTPSTNKERILLSFKSINWNYSLVDCHDSFWNGGGL